MTIQSAMMRAILTGLLFSTSLPSARAAEPVQLITTDEAQLPPSEPGKTDRNLTRGPGVDAVAPSAVGVAGNFRFAVKFKPRNGVKIDPKDVRVTYLREPRVDLTARLRPFITADGIDAPAVFAPPGKHVVVVEAIDKEGRAGQGQVTLIIKPAS